MSDIVQTTEQNTEQSSANHPQIMSQLIANLPETQNRAETGNHLPNGKFAPGNLANPGGRPKSKHITDAYKAILEEKGADELAEVVYKDATSATKASDRLAAVQEITDRVEGKPIQAHMVAMAVDPNAVNTIAALAAKLLGGTESGS